MVKHEALRNSLERAYKNGFSVQRDHLADRYGCGRHMTRVIVTRLDDPDHYGEYLIETSNCDEQARCIDFEVDNYTPLDFGVDDYDPLEDDE